MRLSLAIGSFVGAFRYEFRMQLRRPALWILVGGIGVLAGTAFQHPPTIRRWSSSERERRCSPCTWR